MNDPTSKLPAPSSAVTIIRRIHRALGVTVLACVTAASVSSCSHSDEPKKHKPKKYRDPVEQKIFYDGWWPKNW